MKEFIKNNPKIKLNDFTSIEKSFEYSLRFELGDELPNGTKKRVRQAKRRALEIFKEYFHTEEKIIAISYEWDDEMFARTPNYLFKTINRSKPDIKKPLAVMYFEGEDPEYEKGILGQFELNKSEVNWGKIFKAIANSEMGFDPTCHQILFLFGKKSNNLFWMYDDRGCLIMTHKKADLNNPYKKFNSWLVEHYRNEFQTN